jgi:lipid II:glycine glycyltransferase (peptidoglycan interpeptide bridge formation enzyme)
MNIKGLKQIDLNYFKPDIRRKINKAIKSGITIKTGDKRLVKDFTSVYNRNMHRKGSPSLGWQFFEVLHSLPGVQSEIFVAYKESKPIGGAFAMWYNGYYENIWFSTRSKYNNIHVSYLLHWEMIKSAVDKKVEIYSMGRSSIGSGTHQYKLQWPTEEVFLFFSTNCPGPAKIKKLMWAPKIWKHLPAGIVDRLGPAIAKRIY